MKSGRFSTKQISLYLDHSLSLFKPASSLSPEVLCKASTHHKSCAPFPSPALLPLPHWLRLCHSHSRSTLTTSTPSPIRSSVPLTVLSRRCCQPGCGSRRRHPSKLFRFWCSKARCADDDCNASNSWSRDSGAHQHVHVLYASKCFRERR